MKLSVTATLFLISSLDPCDSFSCGLENRAAIQCSRWFGSRPTCLALSNDAGANNEAVDDKLPEDYIQFSSEEEKKKAVGNLVADDEWAGLSMELAEVVRLAVLEDIKRNAREFLNKEDYQMGDISKEVDSRVKKQVAKLRDKDEYELGDLVLALDELSKQYTEELTGKPYEAGDLSMEIDKRVKERVAEWCGKEEYEFGDLSREMTRRIQSRVEEFTGKPYEFGDITRQVDRQRQEWVKSFLGEEAAKNYQFGDITKKFVTKYTGKDEYQFGDLTKKLVGDLFGEKKRRKSDD